MLVLFEIKVPKFKRICSKQEIERESLALTVFTYLDRNVPSTKSRSKQTKSTSHHQSIK